MTLRDIYKKNQDLSLAEALGIVGTEDLLTDVIRQFCSSADDNISAIENSMMSRDYESYTIKVHALKSSARIIGAEKLSLMAEELEKEGKRLQEETELSKDSLTNIKIKTKEMLDYYRSYIDLLEPVKKYGEADDSEKQEASEEEVTAIKNAILNACDNFDLVTVEEQFAQLKKIKLPPELSSKMQELSKAIENIEFEEIAYIFSR